MAEHKYLFLYSVFCFHVLYVGQNLILWWIGIQNMFGREDIGKLGIYIEGNQGKIQMLAD